MEAQTMAAAWQSALSHLSMHPLLNPAVSHGGIYSAESFSSACIHVQGECPGMVQAAVYHAETLEPTSTMTKREAG